LSTAIAILKQKRKPYNMPLFVAKIIGFVGDLLGEKAPINTLKLIKITSDLTFDDSKARSLLNWKPERVLEYLKTKSI
jgi:nucleoside-diphosphate-sugar epimerase